MSSEIKANTISEVTSANGVSIDGLNIKDSAVNTGAIGSSVTVQAGSPIAVQLASSASSSATAQVDFNSSLITDSYRTYRLCFNLVIPATDLTEPLIYFSQDNGSNFISSGIVSRRQYYDLSNAGSSGGELQDAGYARIGTDLGNDANEGWGGYLDLWGIRETNSVYFFGEGTCVGKHGSGSYRWTNGIRGYKGNSTAINFLRFKMSSGDMAKHDISLVGLK